VYAVSPRAAIHRERRIGTQGVAAVGIDTRASELRRSPSKVT
jgi:hypothetical protein